MHDGARRTVREKSLYSVIFIIFIKFVFHPLIVIISLDHSSIRIVNYSLIELFIEFLSFSWLNGSL